jgi:hypothetical protein
MREDVKKMRRVYIAHPLRGERPDDLMAITDNQNRVRKICLEISKNERGVLILSPIHAFSFFPVQGDHKRALAMCRELLSMADEVRFYGNWQRSEGCRMEFELAMKLGKLVNFPEDDNAAG